MPIPASTQKLKDLRVYFVGIKGTGMAALAELLFRQGSRVTGSDVSEQFYTDQVLTGLGIPYQQGFDPANIPEEIDLVIYSAAYDPEEHPELREARKRGIEIISYTRALGFLSSLRDSSGITGVHGKTTTTALAGTIARGLGLPASVLVGSAVPSLGGGSIYAGGDTYFIAETCEYRRHFLDFHPARIVLTSVEADHLDYYSGLEDILDAFVEYGLKLPAGGELIYCWDDPGASEAAKRIEAQRPDLALVPYGFTAPGPFNLTGLSAGEGRLDFSLACSPVPLSLRIPGRHSALNAAAATALILSLCRKEGRKIDSSFWRDIAQALLSFSGSRRRSEILGEAEGVLFIDDYGHHPTAIKTTLEGIKEFYPGRRLIVDFMSHTYSRTRALIDEFATAFQAADRVILHKIYASAREGEGGDITGEILYERVREHNPSAVYVHEVMDATGQMIEELREGDIFLTMGAGDNWRLGKELYTRLQRNK